MAVTMPHTPGQRDLPGAMDEATMLRDQFPGRVMILHGDLHPEEAARLGAPSANLGSGLADFDSVRATLPRCRWAHFACHAFSDLNDPSASHLLLYDYQRRPLTVVDVARLRLDHADLAFLSACATARTSPRPADETIQLAAGFQLAGYRNVLATLWPIGDRVAVDIASDIYTALATAGNVNAAARALHQATRLRRDLSVNWPSVWAAHIHSGALRTWAYLVRNLLESEGNEMDDEGLLVVARTIRPYLPDLVGPAADHLDQKIAELLATGQGDSGTTALWSLLTSNSVTKAFVAKALADAPHYRPPDLQPDNLLTRDMKPLAGDVGPVQHAGKYNCPYGDYIWYRPAVGIPVRDCPTHHCLLTRI